MNPNKKHKGLQAHKIGLSTAISVVMANMIGTGVFTSLGFQVLGLQSGLAILLLWVLGGFLALCGAFCYAEIGSAFPENGGEYNYLSKLYHPAIGFMSGWVSVTVGFAAPIAAASVAMSDYFCKAYTFEHPLLLSAGLILVITVFHAINMKAGSGFQRVFTYIKLVCIVAFIGCAAFYEPQHSLKLVSSDTFSMEIFSPAFAVSLIFVTYAYSGWNAAAYIAGEIKESGKNLPRALIYGTLTVAVLYTLLNFVFLYTVPLPELKGVVEVGYLSASRLFGAETGAKISLLIAVLLVSTVSAMVLAGPRVMQSMGEHIKGLQFLAIKNSKGVPYVAVLLQSLTALSLVFTSSFESLITYVSFTLNLFTLLTVIGIFILRYKHKAIQPTYRSPLFPLPALFFSLVMIWVLCHIMLSHPMESLMGFGTVMLGWLFYFLLNRARV
jgi:APA family basic amino acid/polyamine antiporter